MRTRTIDTRILFSTVMLVFLVTAIGYSQPNTPSNVVVVPRYEATISLIISWDDNSGDETGFEIERREAGGAFGHLDNVGVNVDTYLDNTATPDKMWEYHVRALGGPAGDSAWSDVSNASSPKIVWPVDDGSHNILHNYGNPLGSAANPMNLYFHDGVDISASGVQVNAARGGRVANVQPGNNGACYINVDCGVDGIYREAYAHIENPDAVIDAGDILAPGDPLASICDVCWGRDPEADHVHWEGEFTATGDKRNNLLIFTQNADRDPNMLSPVVADANNDGEDFIIVDAANNDHTNPRDPAWGDVDFLVDAYDDMAAGFDLVVSPHSIGYWIQPGVPGAEAVRSSAVPYILIAFNYTLCGSPCAPEAVATAALYSGLAADLHGINTWQSYYTWIVTNTRGTDGDPGNVDGNQFWKTDARIGTGAEPNGSDADPARENQEAKFPDGIYFVHIVQEEHVHSADHVRSVLVDNSRPYVRKVTVSSGLRTVYQAEWVWDAGTAQLSIQPATFDAAAAFTALRTQDIMIEVEFSEPMQTASITSITPLGVPPTLTSTQPEHARAIWSGIISNLDIADDGSDDGDHMMTITGTDLAGNQLLQINGRANMGANHHNRNAAGNMQGTPGTDTIHGFKVGPLEGDIEVTAIFMKQTAADLATPTIADKAAQLQQALNNYFDEVSYGEISFAIAAHHGWYQLAHALDWYETTPQNPLIDLVQEAISAVESNGFDITTDYVLVVTDETAARDEWSTNGAWPYTIAPAPGWRLIASGVLNLASSDARVSNLAGRMVGLVDLFAYPEVTVVPRPFVGPWSHMSDKDREVHAMGWEKWRVGWLDETGTATGKTLTRVPKPAVGSPIVNQTYNILPLDSDSDGVKMVAIEIGDRLHYTAEYRRQQDLDAGLPDDGVLIVKANDYINQGEGPAIVQESPVAATLGDLDDATFDSTPARDEFDDVGSGVNIEVTSMNANQAQIRLNYEVPPTENDVYVARHDARVKTEDIWIDAPDLDGNFEADPLTVKDANEKPVVGEINRVYGRVRNKGHADATNFEIRLDIRTPWGAGGPWHSLDVKIVTLLQGQDTNPGAYEIIEGEWEPSSDAHSCVQLTVSGVANDSNTENNWTQENIHEFAATPGSPYTPVISRFEVENPYDETIPVFFKLDGLPPSWSYILTPERLVIPPKGVDEAQVTLQPYEAAPLCSQEQITISAYTPRVDTLKRLGAITLQVALKNDADISMQTWVHCGRDDQYDKVTRDEQQQRWCIIYAQGCTYPKLPNTQVAVVYTAPDGEKKVHYVTTDENGCYLDMLTAGEPGLWEVQTVLEETDCRVEARTPKQPVNVEGIEGFDRNLRYFACFGPNFPLGKFNTIYDPGFSINGGIERLIMPNLTIAALLGFHQFYSPHQNQHFAQVAANLKYTYYSWSDKYAYVQAGGGLYRPRYGSQAFGANVGAGLTWVLTPRLGLDLNFDYHFVNYSNEKEELDRAMFLDLQMGAIWAF